VPPHQLSKGYRDCDQGFEEVPDEEIIKGYEHTKGHYVLLQPKELDALKLEAKHTIDMKEFVDLDQIDSRYFEKPYYLLPDGEEADEGYTVLRDAWLLASSSCMAVNTWSASQPTRRDSCWSSFAMPRSYESQSSSSTSGDEARHQGREACRGPCRARVRQIRAGEDAQRICPSGSRASAGENRAA
jgi:hypothetical protein